MVAKLIFSKLEIVDDDGRFAVETFCNFLLALYFHENDSPPKSTV